MFDRDRDRDSGRTRELGGASDLGHEVHDKVQDYSVKCKINTRINLSTMHRGSRPIHTTSV